jgi:hypothetical protein
MCFAAGKIRKQKVSILGCFPDSGTVELSFENLYLESVEGYQALWLVLEKGAGVVGAVVVLGH